MSIHTKSVLEEMNTLLQAAIQFKQEKLRSLDESFVKSVTKG